MSSFSTISCDSSTHFDIRSPGWARRLRSVAAALGEAGVPFWDTLDALDIALDPLADRAMSGRPSAYDIARAAWDSAWESAAIAALPRFAEEAAAAADFDPIATLCALTERAQSFADSRDIAAAARDALGAPALHGGFEIVEALRRDAPASVRAGLAADVIAELGDFSALAASREARHVLAELPENGDFPKALLARHGFLRPDDASAIARDTLDVLAAPPPRMLVAGDPDNPFSDFWREPNEEEIALHRKALAMGGVPRPEADPEPNERAGIVESRDPETGTLRLSRAEPSQPGLARVRFESGMATRPAEWLAKGLLPRTGLALMYGEGNAGKSFAAVHAALSVSWGLPLFGKRTTRGGVLYIAAEGGKSVIPRFAQADVAMRPMVAAANIARATAEPALVRAPIEIITEAPDLSRDGDAAPLVRTIADVQAEFAAAGERLALVIVDTWHRVLGGGEENSSADTGHVLKPLLAAAERGDFLVLVLHHPGKDAERGTRGSSALPAAADAIIAVTVPGHGGPQAKPSDALRRCAVTKMRDGESGGEFFFRLDTHVIGHDEDGDPVTTCTVRHVPPAARDDEGLSATDRAFMAAIRAAVGEAGDGRAGVREVRERFAAGRRNSSTEASRKAFRRALEAAVTAGRVGVDSGEEWAWMN